MRLQIDKLGKVAITVEEGYWDINKDYDKLTVVEVKEMFATYISRIPTPAGTDITNRKYWIPFSSLKEQIALDYNSFKADVEDRMSSAENEVLKFGRDLNRLQNLNKDVLELVEISRKSLENSEEAQTNSKKALDLATEILDKVSVELGIIPFGDSFEEIDGKIEIKAISIDKLKTILQ